MAKRDIGEIRLVLLTILGDGGPKLLDAELWRLAQFDKNLFLGSDLCRDLRNLGSNVQRNALDTVTISVQQIPDRSFSCPTSTGRRSPRCEHRRAIRKTPLAKK